MTPITDPENEGKQTKNVLSTKTIDPQLPPMQLMKFTYASVGGASIAIIIYILYLLLHCGCK